MTELEPSSRDFKVSDVDGHETERVRLYWDCSCKEWALGQPCQHVVRALDELAQQETERLLAAPEAEGEQE